jgi:hypothetical protein
MIILSPASHPLVIRTNCTSYQCKKGPLFPSTTRATVWPSKLYFSNSSLRATVDSGKPVTPASTSPSVSHMREVQQIHPGLTFVPPVPPPCAECVTDCQEPCSVVEMTSQCTDQCVVIACHDPDHGDWNCQEGHAILPCDLTCEDSKDCSDCAGLEDFVSEQHT